LSQCGKVHAQRPVEVTIFHLIHFLIIHFYSLDNQTDRSGTSNLCKCEGHVKKERKAVLLAGMHSFQK